MHIGERAQHLLTLITPTMIKKKKKKKYCSKSTAKGEVPRAAAVVPLNLSLEQPLARRRKVCSGTQYCSLVAGFEREK